MGTPVRIDNFAAEHHVVPFLQAVEFQASAGHQALTDMRQMIGRSGPAARWSALSLTARQMICYGAHLRPSTYASRELDEMTIDEREAIRRAIRAVREISGVFGDALLDRRDWMLIPTRATAENSMEAQKAEMLRRAQLANQARMLQARMAATAVSTTTTS